MSVQYTIFDAQGKAVRRVLCPEKRIHRFVKAGEEARKGSFKIHKPDDAAGAVRSAMIDLERRQLRAMRELLIDPDNTAARDRLRDIDRQVGDFRAMFILLGRKSG